VFSSEKKKKRDFLPIRRIFCQKRRLSSRKKIFFSGGLLIQKVCPQTKGFTSKQEVFLKKYLFFLRKKFFPKKKKGRSLLQEKSFPQKEAFGIRKKGFFLIFFFLTLGKRICHNKEVDFTSEKGYFTSWKILSHREGFYLKEVTFYLTEKGFTSENRIFHLNEIHFTSYQRVLPEERHIVPHREGFYLRERCFTSEFTLRRYILPHRRGFYQRKVTFYITEKGFTWGRGCFTSEKRI